MRVLTYVYDSEQLPDHVESTLAALAAREEPVDRLDVSAFDDRHDGIRRATLAIKEGVGIGTIPDALFDADGGPDFTAGALIVEAETGRRSLHVGEDAHRALEGDG